jgi:hypothetical protein
LEQDRGPNPRRRGSNPRPSANLKGEGVTDFDGNEIEVGDSIIYAALAGRCAVLHRGRVLGFKDMPADYYHREAWRKIKGEIKGWKDKPKIVYLEFPERVIAVKGGVNEPTRANRTVPLDHQGLQEEAAQVLQEDAA